MQGNVFREIERKFLVKDNSWKKEKLPYLEIKQGYLNTDPNKTVRIRIAFDGHAYTVSTITIKGLTDDDRERFEWERELNMFEVTELLNICDSFVHKNRYFIEYENHTFMVDEYLDELDGLVIAEVELNDKDEVVELPEWVGMEVTGNPMYYNSNLLGNNMPTFSDGDLTPEVINDIRDKHHFMTVKDLKKKLETLDDDAIVTVENVPDYYFKRNKWHTHKINIYDYPYERDVYVIPIFEKETPTDENIKNKTLVLSPHY